MMTVAAWSVVATIGFAAFTEVHAQQAPVAPTVLTPVPRLVGFSGVFRPADQLPIAAVETVTVAVYRDRDGGDAVWQETQAVTMAADGRYSLLMGSTLANGLPLEVFTSGEPRWIGITVQRPGEAEQPRVHLASVPYALKAADADTLGGHPASAYLLADPALSPATSAASADASKDATPTPSAPSAGTAGSLGMFVDSSTLGNSALVQSGGSIGLGTTIPRDALHVAVNNGTGAFAGYAVQNLSGAPAAYSGMLFYDQNGALGQFQGFNNATHEYRINNIASGGRINFMIGSSSKFLVANNGNVGVGVAVPASKLDVAGDINLTGTLKLEGSTVLRYSSDLGNVGLGERALGSNSTGYFNTATGRDALFSNTGGAYNTANGISALKANQTGGNNTAVGAHAVMHNTIGENNTGVGASTLYVATGSNNTAAGYAALFNSTAGFSNTGVGAYALYHTSGPEPTGSYNTSVGHGAMYNNIGGSFNVAVGYLAGVDVHPDNSNNIEIGARGWAEDSGAIRIGTIGTQTSFFAAGVRGVTTGRDNAVAVVIDSSGQLGTVSSSRRFKEDIQDMGDASHGLMRLRPVTFRYRTPFDDGSKPIQYGLIAEEVAEVYPDLVARAADGQIETVKYQVLDAMLLNEVQQQQAEIRGLHAEVRALVQQNRAIVEQNKDLQTRLASLEAAFAGRR